MVCDEPATLVSIHVTFKCQLFSPNEGMALNMWIIFATDIFNPLMIVYTVKKKQHAN